MKEKLKKLIGLFFTPEFLKFVAIGVVNTFSTSILASVIDNFIPAKPAFVIGYIGGVVISFFLNTYFTFREKPTLEKALRFPVTCIPNFVAQYLAVWIFVDGLALPETVAYVAAAIVGVPVTFLTMRLFVYRKK